MSKVLVVKGHPLTAEASFSVKGLDAFLATYKAANPTDTIEVVDVFEDFIPEVDKDILTAWGALTGGAEFSSLSEEQQKKVARFNELTEQFLNSDKVVVANPLWNLFIPASLKAWMDTIMVAGKTFRYTENGPVGMTQGKKLFHIQANGGVYEAKDPASEYVKGIFKFIGFDEANIEEVEIEGHAYAPEKADELASEFIAKIEKIAATF